MLIDSHCHLPHHNFDISPDSLVSEAAAEGVTSLITIGTSIKDNELAMQAASQFPAVYCSIAIYPHDDIGTTLTDLENILKHQLSACSKIVAIGECGVDVSNWEGGRPLIKQLELFEMQINLALANDLPVIVHNRNGNNEFLALLKKYPKLRGVAHCFSQDWEYAKKLLDVGFYISFAGNITYPSNKHLLETVQKVPVDRYLVETDSPYLPPQGHRGEVNMPKYVKIVAEKAAVVRNSNFDQVSKETWRNTRALFKLPI